MSYERPKTKREEEKAPQYKLGVCAVYRCCGTAALSHSTKGGGPYYCARHFRDPSAPPMTYAEAENDNARREKLNRPAVYGG